MLDGILFIVKCAKYKGPDIIGAFFMFLYFFINVVL